VESSPAVADGKIYVGSEDGKVYAFGPVRDVAVTNVTPFKTVVGQGYYVSLNITVENQGNSTETDVNVTAYANDTVISPMLISSLAPKEKMTLTIVWKTPGFAKGNYNVSATATPVKDETDVADNTYVYGIVKVTIPGDVNGDFIVNIKDAALVGLHWQQPIIPPLPSPPWDINGDGVINIKDATIVGINWLKDP
jgi:hypothetical protein